MESNPASSGMSQSFQEADITSGDGSNGGRGGDVGSHNKSTVAGQIKEYITSFSGKTVGNTYVYGGSVSNVSKTDNSVRSDNSSHMSNSYSVTTSPASLTSALSSPPLSPQLLTPLTPSFSQGASFFPAVSPTLGTIPDIEQDQGSPDFQQNQHTQLPKLFFPELAKTVRSNGTHDPTNGAGGTPPYDGNGDAAFRTSMIGQQGGSSPDSFHSTREVPSPLYQETNPVLDRRSSESPGSYAKRPQFRGLSSNGGGFPRPASVYGSDRTSLNPNRTRSIDKIPDYRMVENCKILLTQIEEIKAYEEQTVPSELYEKSRQIMLDCKKGLETSIQAARRAREGKRDETILESVDEICASMRETAIESKDTFEVVSHDLEQLQSLIDEVLASLKDGKHSKAKRAKVDSILGVAASATIIGAPLGALFGARAAYHAAGAQNRRKAVQRIEPIRYTVANLHRDIGAILTWWRSVTDLLPGHNEDITQSDAIVGYVDRSLDKYLAVMEHAQKDLTSVLKAQSK